jgi:hypothetical protein
MLSDSESYLDWHRTKKTHPDQHKKVHGMDVFVNHSTGLYCAVLANTVLYCTVWQRILEHLGTRYDILYGRCRMNFAILFPLRERVSFLWCYLGLLNRENNGQYHERQLDPCCWNLHIVFFYCLFFFRYCLPLYMYLERNRMEALLKCASW